MPEDDQTSPAEEPQEDLVEDGLTQSTEEPPATDLGVPERDEPRRPSTNAELELIHRHAFLAAATASGMKAEEIRILDVHELVPYTDFLVICNGRSVRQTRRIAEEIGFKLKSELERMPKRVEGQASGEWVLMDYLDFIVHVFTPEAREFYRLDVLWKEAPREVLE